MPFYYKGSSLNPEWNLTMCRFSFFYKKTTKKTWCTFQKNRYVLWNLSFYYNGFSLNLSEISRLPFFCQKNNYKNTMYSADKLLRFVKIVVFLLVVFLEILSEISPFALFLIKKQLKKHDVPCKKTVTFYETCRSIIRGFF